MTLHPAADKRKGPPRPAVVLQICAEYKQPTGGRRLPPPRVEEDVGAAAWALLSIEEIGHIIEEPFNMPFESTEKCPRTTLGMEGIAATVRADVRARAPRHSSALSTMQKPTCYSQN